MGPLQRGQRSRVERRSVHRSIQSVQFSKGTPHTNDIASLAGDLQPLQAVLTLGVFRPRGEAEWTATQIKRALVICLRDCASSIAFLKGGRGQYGSY